jgi:hypothetical protein
MTVASPPRKQHNARLGSMRETFVDDVPGRFLNDA